MLLLAVLALLRWDFLFDIRAIARCGLGAHKGPLYDYACVIFFTIVEFLS